MIYETVYDYIYIYIYIYRLSRGRGFDSQPEGLGVAFFATGPGLGIIMYILTTLEFPTHYFDFHILTTWVNANDYYYLYLLIFLSILISCSIYISILLLLSLYVYFFAAICSFSLTFSVGKL